MYQLTRGFSRQHRIMEFATTATHHLSGSVSDGFAYHSPYRLTPVQPLTGPTTFLRHPIACLLPAKVPCITPLGTRRCSRGIRMVSTTDSAWARIHGYGNINPLSIDYACRPRLRSRLTLGGLAWPRNPWSSGGQGSHLPYRYSCLHSHSHTLHHSITRRLHRIQDAPLPSTQSVLPRLRRCA